MVIKHLQNIDPKSWLAWWLQHPNFWWRYLKIRHVGCSRTAPAEFPYTAPECCQGFRGEAFLSHGLHECELSSDIKITLLYQISYTCLIHVSLMCVGISRYILLWSMIVVDFVCLYQNLSSLFENGMDLVWGRNLWLAEVSSDVSLQTVSMLPPLEQVEILRWAFQRPYYVYYVSTLLSMYILPHNLVAGDLYIHHTTVSPSAGCWVSAPICLAITSTHWANWAAQSTKPTRCFRKIRMQPCTALHSLVLWGLLWQPCLKKKTFFSALFCSWKAKKGLEGTGWAPTRLGCQPPPKKGSVAANAERCFWNTYRIVHRILGTEICSPNLTH